MRIRQGNDFIFLWAIERNGLPEDFSNAVNIRLHFKNFDCIGEVKSFQIVDGNIVRVEVSPEWASNLGAYRLILSYEFEDQSYSDGDRKCVVDVLAFNIVPKTSEADDVTEMAKTTDIMIGLKGAKGDPFTYEDFTPEQIEDLKRPAIEAAENANTAAQNADDAREAIEGDLALRELKANKQNSLTPDGTGTKFPTVDAVNAGLAGAGETLVATYVHSGNLEITVTGVDLATGVFTSVGHGLVEDDALIFCMNNSLSPDILGKYIPNGLTHSVILYAVYVDSDHFAVSATAARVQLTFTSNATMDLTKWHFEKAATTLAISNLPEMTKCRVELSGVCVTLRYLRPDLPISDTWVGNRDVFGSVHINGYSVWLDGELIFDTTNRVTIKGLMKGLAVNTSTANSYKEEEILLVNYQENVRGVTFNSIFIKHQPLRVANGFTIKIYKL